MDSKHPQPKPHFPLLMLFLLLQPDPQYPMCITLDQQADSLI
jgi:hypothetical protein